MKHFNSVILLITSLLLLFVSKPVYADDFETVTAVPVSEFLNSIGVNTSLNARGETILQTIECLNYIGARYIRSGAPDGTNVRTDHFRWLYEECDARFSMILSPEGDANPANGYPGGIPHLIQGAKDVIAAIKDPEAIVGFEGCNEPNNWGNIYQGEKGGGHWKQEYNETTGKWEDVFDPQPWKPLARYQRDFYAALKADPVLGTSGYNYPVWSMTDVGTAWENVGLHFLTVPQGAEGVDAEFPAGTIFADVACIHNYFIHPAWGARSNNQTWVAADPVTRISLNSLYGNFGKTWSKGYDGYSDEQLLSLPRVTSETGTTIDGLNITEEMQGLMYLSCYLAQFKQGFRYTAIYILRDRVDEGGNQTFGFYKPSYQPRTSAHYLHNMTSILADRQSIAQTGALRYAFSSKPVTVHDLLLQKSDGTMMLVVWSEKYARGAGADNIDLQFDETVKRINVYNPAQYSDADPEAGIRPVATYSNVSQIPLSLLNHPYIIEINPVETSIEEIPVRQEAHVYYDPEEDLLYIRSAASLNKVELFDLAGKSRWSRSGMNTNAMKLNAPLLAKGCYILKITGMDNRTEAHKIIN
jgi:hypothetical protein